jgi:hypothetical protein
MSSRQSSTPSLSTCSTRSGGSGGAYVSDDGSYGGSEGDYNEEDELRVVESPTSSNGDEERVSDDGSTMVQSGFPRELQEVRLDLPVLKVQLERGVPRVVRLRLVVAKRPLKLGVPQEVRLDLPVLKVLLELGVPRVVRLDPPGLTALLDLRLVFVDLSERNENLGLDGINVLAET